MDKKGVDSMGFFIYVGRDGKKRERRPLKPKTVDCEVLEAPQARTVADLMLNPTPEEEAERKRKQFDAQMTYLRKNNPKLAKKVWRRHILISVLAAVAFLGVCFIVAKLTGRI
jgi:hypothetical protein